MRGENKAKYLSIYRQFKPGCHAIGHMLIISEDGKI